MERNEVAVIEHASLTPAIGGVFSGESAFETAQRMAKALATSDLVPTTYKGNISNCLVAMELSQRTGSSVLAVMQNLNVIHGKPSWGSSYIIAALNACGRFAPLRFRKEGEGDNRTCVAWTVDKSGEVLEGPPVSIAMAKTEGWFDKNGSKWKTMPELMMMYRAAAFFGRLYAPDVLMGMQTDDEVRDVTPAAAEKPASAVSEINQKVKARGRSAKTAEPALVDIPAAPAAEEAKEEFF